MGAEGGLPRWVRTFGIPAAGVALVLFFMVVRFPYDRLRDYVASELSRATGASVRIQQLSPALRLAGPAIEVAGVEAVWPDGERIALDRAVLRPAWSLAWLRGDQSLHGELEGAIGHAEGTFTSGETPALEAELRGVDLTALPLGTWWPGAAVQGVIDATLDVSVQADGAAGPVSFQAREGTIELPGLPLAIPYESLAGDLVLGGEALLAVSALQLAGPLIEANVTGSIGRAPSVERAPLQLEVVVVAEPAVHAALQGLGVRIGRDGTARLRVSGTASVPVVR